MFSLLSFLIVGMLVFWSFEWIGWVGTLYFLGHPWMDLNFCFMLDGVSLMCVYMLFCCSVIALFYCYHYFSSDESGVFLFFLVCWFIFVMLFLMLSFSVIFSLVMWEYLGLVSFFLILFYGNSVSLRASLITLFASRFGDVSLFVLVLWSSACWNFSVAVVMVLLLMVVLTKSACYPFMSWLIEAMRAPTPVSSLVHSSTLVAAGVWFLLRYPFFFDCRSLSFLLILSLVTIIISGIGASIFVDLKKIVALSTCNNISWCIVFFVCGDLTLALLQLLSHGVAKCYLFMTLGDTMGGSSGNQDSKLVYLNRYSGEYAILMQFALVFSLCGLPLLGVFFGKHEFFSAVFYSYDFMFLGILLFCYLLSYVYSFRLYFMLLGDCIGMFSMYVSNFILISFLVLLSTFLNYDGSFFFDEVSSLNVVQNVIILLIQTCGAVLGYLMWWVGCFRPILVWSSSLWGSDFVIGFIYSIFLKISAFFVLGLYRWEVLGLSVLRRKVCNGYIIAHRDSLFSLNIMIFGVALFVSLYMFLYV